MGHNNNNNDNLTISNALQWNIEPLQWYKMLSHVAYEKEHAIAYYNLQQDSLGKTVWKAGHIIHYCCGYCSDYIIIIVLD